MGALFNAVASEGFWILAAAALVAGIVRGFSAFAGSMIFLPVAAQIMPPFAALATVIAMDLTSRAPTLPLVMPAAHRRDIVLLGLGALVAVPMGVAVLGTMTPDVFRTIVSIAAVLLVVMLASNFQYRGRFSDPVLYGTGAVTGFISGSVGMPGPLLIRLYKPSDHSAETIHANTMLYLLVCDVLVLGALLWSGYLVGTAVAAGVVLAFPYLAGNVIGQKMFRPELRQAYRVAAYVIVIASALIGLPLFD